MVGVDPRHLRDGMEKVVRYVESLGVAEVVADDVTVLRIDEIEELEDDDRRRARGVARRRAGVIR